MANYKKYINALRKCAKEHDNDTTYTGHIRVSDLCRDTANLLEELKQEPCNDAISRQAAIDCLNADFTIDGKENMETVVDYITGAFKQIKALPSVIPQQKVGHWVLAGEQNKEDVENDNYRFICSECQCSDIHAKGIKVPYCWKCGAKMVEVKERDE